MLRSAILIAVFGLAGCGLIPPSTPDAAESSVPTSSVPGDRAVGGSTTQAVGLPGIPAPVAAANPAPAVADSVVMSRLDLESLLEMVRAGRSDTLVVRIDTARAAAPDTAGSTEVRRLREGLRNVGSRIFLSILILLGVYYVLRAVLWLIETIAERSATRRLFFKRLIPIVRMMTWAFVVYFIIANVFEVDRNGLIAASAALGVGIGLAAQDVIKNILGGIIIIFDAPFQVGDKISVGGTYGEVKSIGLRSTRIVTLDDNLVSVPNSQVIDGQVANANAGALDCQVVTNLYLPGWVDADRAKRIAYEAAANSRYVFLEKPIVVLVKDEFKETFLLHLLVKAYVLDTRYESVFASEVTETAKRGFLEAGLLFPVAGLRLHDEAEGRSEGAE